MSANVETMMYVREKPWHGLGTMVQEAPNSEEALRLAGSGETSSQSSSCRMAALSRMSTAGCKSMTPTAAGEPSVL